MTIIAITNVDLFDGHGIRHVLSQCFEGSPGNVIQPQSLPDVSVDGTGCTLIPGLIDCKVDANSSPTALSSFAAYGVTTVIDLVSSSAENQAMRRESRSPKMPSYLGSGCVLGSEATASRGLFPFRAVRVVKTPSEARRLVEELVEDPIRADYINIIADQPGLDPETLAAASHAYDAALLAGFDIVTAVPVDGPLDASTVQGFAEQGIAVVPTLCSVQQASQGEATPGCDFGFAIAAVRQLYCAGVRICAGTTAYQRRNTTIPFGTSLHDELELLSKAGLSNLDVLRAATCVPATVFRLHDRGTIEAGKRADLVLVHGTPLTDLTATRRIRQAWIEGVGVEVEMELAVKAEVEGKA
ncbi:hypothetical protein ACCO45_009544 [Purpureocillium lilacinum]|uniref:Uncharacterized protein n=1 Tax=Purpureocillium lilacinum TaxID=33203 RepID=A0ACC4DKR6_PURLI